MELHILNVKVALEKSLIAVRRVQALAQLLQ